MSRPLFVRRLTAREEKELLRLCREPPNTRVYQRVLAVRLSSEGHTCQAIGEIVSRDPSTVYRWLVGFNDRGIDGLTPGKSPGRPPKADARVRATLVDAVRQNPRDLGYRFTRWTAALLVEHVHRTNGVDLCSETVGMVLRQMGYRYGCPKLDLKHRQDPGEVRRARRQRTCAIKKQRAARVAGPSCISTKPNST